MSDIRPSTARISQWRTIERLFGNYQFQSPGDLEAGAFDMGFLILFVMPLVMIVLGFDALSEDKESGRLGQLLSQPLSVKSLVLARLRVRFGAVALIALGALLMALLIGAPLGELGARVPAFALWLLVAFAYFLFWAALVFWGVSLKWRGETTVLLLVGIWVVNGLVGPSLLSAVAEIAYPTPSRLAFLSETRERSVEAYKDQADIMQGMLLDHPELTTKNYELPEYIRTGFLVTQSVDEAIAPVLERFDEAQEQRRSFLAFGQFLSPAVSALRAMNAAAGTDLERHISFEKAARAHKRKIADTVEGNILVGQRLTLAEYDALPGFVPPAQTALSALKASAVPVLYLMLLALVLWVRGSANLERLQTRIRES